MMDTFVTLIGFLLYTMAFLTLVMIESPLPTTTPEAQAEKLKEKPLQLTVSIRDKETEIWSPFERIKAVKIANLPDASPDVKAIHEALIGVKKTFPKERKIVVAPTGATSYETLILAMDSIRLLDATDPPFFLKNEKTGVDESDKNLFPEVIFGNILSND